MKKCVAVLALATIMSLFAAAAVQASGSASPREVADKVKQAAKYLSEKGSAGLSEFNDKSGPWVWKDTYVFVFDCTGKQSLVAHVVPAMVGRDLNTLKDVKGSNLGTLLCGGVSEHPDGVWVEYLWPKVSRGGKTFERKLSYMMKVPGQPYEVGAGAYGVPDSVSIDQMNAKYK